MRRQMLPVIVGPGIAGAVVALVSLFDLSSTATLFVVLAAAVGAAAGLVPFTLPRSNRHSPERNGNGTTRTTDSGVGWHLTVEAARGESRTWRGRSRWGGGSVRSG